ncbi:UNVERIFIED_CONTAM: hypothetical protein Sangu_2408800 [Sesamum angustifolium]|uniref:Reverse transcriptase domain-containing protein n=1 Tax=Sesamum angustifolium TaxID=2727405 RepID=A0AAW2KZG1_9LAMI
MLPTVKAIKMNATFFTRWFSFASVTLNNNNKIWCFAAHGIDVQVLKESPTHGPTKGFAKDWIAFSTPNNGWSSLIALDLVEQAKNATSEAKRNFDRNPTNENLINLNKQNTALIHALSLESEFWMQKINCKWLEAGERKSKFFHSLVKKKRIKSKIHRIVDEGLEITESTEIKNSIAEYFRNLLTAPTSNFSDTDFPFQFPQVPKNIARELCKPPTLDDLKEVVFNINKNSVVGPDGFSSAFYQSCWSFIANDLIDATRDFFGGTPIRRSFTTTTITLIPKTDSPQTWSDFKPISLCNVTNKILSKHMYNKISALLPSMISPSQSSFVPGRLIGDNILLAQELTHSIDQRYSKGNVIIKLDMSKVYDKVC